MKITISSTTRIVDAGGIDCRVWEGETERGVKVVCLIPRIAVPNDQDQSQFEAELEQKHAPTTMPDVFPLRMII